MRVCVCAVQVKGELDQDDQTSMYGCFKHLAGKPDVELRRSCAQQIGQVVRAAVSLAPNAYQQHFSDTFQSFATDFDEEVGWLHAHAHTHTLGTPETGQQIRQMHVCVRGTHASLLAYMQVHHCAIWGFTRVCVCVCHRFG